MNVSGAFYFLFSTLFDIYISIVLARFILQLVRADFYNPVSQFIVKATNPLLIPSRRIIPGFGGLDIASLVVFVLLIVIKIALTVHVFGVAPQYPNPLLISYFQQPSPLLFILLTLLTVATTIINFFLFVIFVSAILSWVTAAGGGYNPFADILRQMAEPVLAPARKIIPPMGGLDISPMLVILAIYFIKQLFGLSGLP